MNLFDLIHTEQPQKGIVLTKQGGWVGAVEVGDVVNINNETFRVVGPPHCDTLMLHAETENGYVLIKTNGHTRYFDMQDKLHRDDGPAVSWHEGAWWYRHGEQHREDGPAVVKADGTEMWVHNGDLHREDGPAITRPDGTLEWYYNGKRHREDGPAITWADGSAMWYYRNQKHREDGPAVTWADGTVEYWLHGEQVNKEDLP